jgi:hypothetical protein
VSRRTLLFSIASLFVLAAAAFWLFLPSCPITEANCALIKEGMSLSDVEAILQGPAPYYLGTMTYFRSGQQTDGTPCVLKGWVGRQGQIAVAFDENGRVVVVQYEQRQQESIMDRIRAWLGFAQVRFAAVP